MRLDRVTRILAPSLALAALAALLVLLGLAVAGPAHAGTKATASPEVKAAASATAKAAASPAAKTQASPSGEPAIVLQRGAEVQFGEDVYVPAGTTTPSVVVFGGDITVDGTVTDAVVAFGGDVTIRGTVGTSTVAFGGDVTVGPDAVLGSDLKTSDASLVLFGGKLTQAPGAEIVGQTQIFEGIDLGGAFGWAAKGFLLNPGGFSFIGWLVQTAFCLVLALVITALLPRQLRTVQQNVGRRPWASLGWGALVFFVVGPAVLLVLVISIIGLLLVLPYLLCVLLAYFIATTGAAAFLAQRVLIGFGGKENLMLAVTIGVVGTTVISQIPVAGPLLMLVLMVFGVGAAAIGAADWRRRRREAAVARAAAAAQYAAAGGAVAQPSVINPMVYTAPDVPVGGGPAVAVTVPQPAVPAAVRRCRPSRRACPCSRRSRLRRRPRFPARPLRKPLPRRPRSPTSRADRGRAGRLRARILRTHQRKGKHPGVRRSRPQMRAVSSPVRRRRRPPRDDTGFGSVGLAGIPDTKAVVGRA